MSINSQVPKVDISEVISTSTVMACVGNDAIDVQIMSEQASAKMTELLEAVKCTKGARGDSFDILPAIEDAVAIESDHHHGFRV